MYKCGRGGKRGSQLSTPQAIRQQEKGKKRRTRGGTQQASYSELFRRNGENNSTRRNQRRRNQRRGGDTRLAIKSSSRRNGIEAEGKKERRGVDAEQASNSELFRSNCENNSTRRDQRGGSDTRRAINISSRRNNGIETERKVERRGVDT
jgi:hypothetical protein